MIIVGRLYRVLRRHVRRVSWGMVALALLAHMGLSWVLFVLAVSTSSSAWTRFRTTT